MIATLAAADPYFFTRRGQGWGGMESEVTKLDVKVWTMTCLY